MFLVILSPLALILIGGWILKATEPGRELNAAARESRRRAQMPKRSARWAGRQWQR